MGLPNRPTLDSEGHGWLGDASVGHRGEEEEEQARKKMLARDALEKRRRAHAREGLPLEGSLSKEDDDDDDDDEGMEVRLGFSAEAGLWSESASAGPFDGVDVPAQGPTSSLSEARTSAEPNLVTAVVDEAGAME